MRLKSGVGCVDCGAVFELLLDCPTMNDESVMDND